MFQCIFTNLPGSITPQFELLYIGARVWWCHFLLQSNDIIMCSHRCRAVICCRRWHVPSPIFPSLLPPSSSPLCPSFLPTASSSTRTHVLSLWLCAYQTVSLAPVVADTMETHRARHFAARTHKNRKETCWYLTQDHISCYTQLTQSFRQRINLCDSNN